MTTSSKSAPGPKPAPLIGNMREMNKLGIIGFGQHVWKEYGDVSRFQFGPMRAHLFVRPEHVKHILVEHRENYTKGASHDKLRIWRRRRKIVRRDERSCGYRVAPQLTLRLVMSITVA